ncbi:neuroglian-like isoform X2 [Stegodyphus dumicola]|uniref:neuroglian-like isoform X2 n=1 Tax=Stegodyphus dumicola TaxID=202533 RepID=UPI0015AFBB14|nr:neuroglian-like isoform X2 [Stegodyphus dumicola]
MAYLKLCIVARVLLLVYYCNAITTIPYPPTMIKQPNPDQLFQVSQTQDEQDKPFILECEARGNPEPEYRWTKNSEKFDFSEESDRINQQPKRGTLYVNKPIDTDEGIYQCFAENIYGTSVSVAVHLKKAELNSFPDEETKEVFVIEGEPLTLSCKPPSGYPKPTIFWIIQSNTGALHSINSSRITVDPEGNLHFSNVTDADALDDAQYACSATSMFRNEYKLGNKILLRVETAGPGQNKYPPTKQYVSNPNIVALRGNKLELSCIFGGTPVPRIVWSKKGSSLQTNRITYTNYGKTLKIRKVDFQDEGTYECTASNGVGSSTSESMAVTVQAAPYWINVPNNTNGAEDETVSFECVSGGIPAPEVEWFMNGIPLANARPNPRRRLDKSANVLVIESLKKSDTAVFQCNASNIHGYIFKDFYLNVLALPPTITERPDPVTSSVVSSMVTLRCRVFGAPNPKIKWLRENQELKGDRFQVQENGDLEITDVRPQDEGEYTCYATNKFGDIQASGRLEVKKKTKINMPPENFEVAAGKSATFRCDAEADSSLQLIILWLFNGQPINFDMDARMVQAADDSLTITKTIESDSGTYTCVAKTDLDQDEATATLIVQDTPNPPKIQGVQCDGLTALVVWQPTGDRRAPILSYTIQYNTSFTPDKWEDAFVNIPAPDTRFKVSMTPWANYTFRVIARNKIGPSEPSGPSGVCETPEDVPYKNPDNVVGKGTEKDNLVISWTAMPMIEQNAPGFFYKVFWKREDIPGALWETAEIPEWEQNSFMIPNQPTFKPYRIKVEAHNSKGQAHTAATEVIGYSGEDVPLEAPKNFNRMYVKDARSAMFSWDPVSPESVRGHFRGYKIQTWTVDEGEERLREQVVKANVTQSLVTIFRPHSRNLVRVLAFNDMYNGPPSDVIEFMTPEGTPGPVSYFSAIPLGSSALYLIWKRPTEPNGVLTGYNIYYSEVSGTQVGNRTARKPQITDPRETRAKLAGLKPKTTYRIEIYATTKNGEGEKLFIETQTGDQAERPPDEPYFVWSHLPDVDGKAGVRVTWVPAGEGHPGSHFYVRYRKKGATSWESTQPEENQDSIIVTGLELGSLYEMKVVAVDGRFQTSSKVEEFETGGMAAVQAPESSENFATAAWFIGMMCAIALLLLLLIIICLIKRNRGGKYSVHEKEAAQGRDLEYPEDGGFNEYTKPAEAQPPIRGSRTSLNSSVKGPESETDSMVEYGEGEASKFTEDGSFIGQYGAKKKKEDSTSPSALATFV